MEPEGFNWFLGNLYHSPEAFSAHISPPQHDNTSGA